MNDPHIWWYLSRAAGIVAWLMLTASVLWGIVLATDLFPKWRHAPTLLAMHRWLAGMTFFFIAGHLVTLLFDGYAKFRVADLLVPFSSTWKPTAIAVGIVALYLLIAVQLTALGMKRLSKKWWRDVHIVSYFVFWSVSIHGALTGTDTAKTLYVATAVVALAAVVFAASYRVLSHDLPKRKPARAATRSVSRQAVPDGDPAA
jgi:methionine sulfoxide reductase heme-binding subunit